MQIYPRFPGFSLLCAILLSLLYTPSLAAPGDLDPTFGTGGKVITDFFSDDDAVDSVAVLPDGKIVAAGTTTSTGFGRRRDVAIARYLPDGSLDPTYDFDGRAIFRIFDFSSKMTPRDALIDSGGGVLAVGDLRRVDPPRLQEMFALKMLPNGKPDPGFADNGFFLSAIGSAGAQTAAVQEGGKIVLVGTVGDVSGIGGLTLLRIDGTGSVDASFGTGGISLPEIGADREDKLRPTTAMTQPDGKILVGGHIGVQFSPRIDVITVARFHPDGEPDLGFGTDGRVLTPLGPGPPRDDAKALALQPDGKILVAGTDGSDAALLRFTPGGQLDESFGDGGVVIQDFDGIQASGRSVLLQPDCKIVVAGFVATTLLSGHSFLARYRPDGTPDPGFGDGGLVLLEELGFDLALQEDGKIIVAGTTAIPPTRDFFLARYEGKADTLEGLLFELRGQVECLALPPKIERKLLKRLDRVLSALERREVHRSCKRLRDFVRQLRGPVKKEALTPAEAERLFAAAEEIALELGCPEELEFPNRQDENEDDEEDTDEDTDEDEDE